MKTSNLLTTAFVSLFFLTSFCVKAQVTDADNLPTFGNYVGFNASSLIPLPIRNDAAQPIQWWTDGTRRMTLGATGNLALGNNQDPVSFVKFYVLQNRPAGIGVLATNNSEEVIGIQARVNTATSTTPLLHAMWACLLKSKVRATMCSSTAAFNQTLKARHC